MNGTSGFQEVRSSTSDHHQIGSCTSNGLNSEQVPGAFSFLTISSLAPRAPIQNKKRFTFENTGTNSMNRRCLALYILLTFSIFNSTADELVWGASECNPTWGLLDIAPVVQKGEVWCWAASANAVLNFHGVIDPQSTSTPPLYSQCRLYNIAKIPGTDCCSLANPNDDARCNSTGWPEEVFDNLDPIVTFRPGGALLWHQVKGQLCPNGALGKPFIYAAHPYQSGAIPHTYVAKGFNEDGEDSQQVGQRVIFVDSHQSMGPFPYGASFVDYECYYQGICETTTYIHDGGYYDINPPIVDTPINAPPKAPNNLEVR
jgi:hypothetical protein